MFHFRFYSLQVESLKAKVKKYGYADESDYENLMKEDDLKTIQTRYSDYLKRIDESEVIIPQAIKMFRFAN